MTTLLIAMSLLGQSPPPASVTVVVTGCTYKGATLDGTYTLTRRRDGTYRCDLPVMIGPVKALKFSLHNQTAVQEQTMFVRVIENRPNVVGGESSQFCWTRRFLVPLTIDQLSDTQSNSAFNLTPATAIAPYRIVPGTASVSAN